MQRDSLTTDATLSSSSIPFILNCLKQEFRSRRLTYRDIAQRLKVSKVTVNRYMSGHGLTLGILEQLCGVAGLSLLDFFEQVRSDDPHKRTTLTLEQELALAEDPPMIAILSLLLRHWPIQKIQEVFQLKEAALTRFLTRLDRLELIELRPYNKLTIKTEPKIVPRANGPLRKLQASAIRARFSQFDPADDKVELNEKYYRLSSHSFSHIVTNLFDKLHEEISELERQDLRASLDTTKWHSVLALVRSGDSYPTQPKKLTRTPFTLVHK